jgi:hypothetical protein
MSITMMIMLINHALEGTFWVVETPDTDADTELEWLFDKLPLKDHGKVARALS